MVFLRYGAYHTLRTILVLGSMAQYLYEIPTARRYVYYVSCIAPTCAAFLCSVWALEKQMAYGTSSEGGVSFLLP
jgi:hypothetical protein